MDLFGCLKEIGILDDLVFHPEDLLKVRLILSGIPHNDYDFF